MANNAAQFQYDSYHTEFENWFTTIHPEHSLNFEWVRVFDSGWYKEDTANGAWIAWLVLTNKTGIK